MISFLAIVIIGILVISVMSGKNLDVVFIPLSIVFLCILMGGNLKNPDTDIYINMYYQNNFVKDIGFGLLIKLGNYFGLGFYHFKLLISILGLSMISVSLLGLVKNKSIFITLYFIYPFFFDIVQIRNFLCMAFFILGFRFLINEKKSGKFLFIIFVLLGASMQKIGLIYLPIVFFKDIYKKKWLKKMAIIFILISIIVGLSDSFLQSFTRNFLFFLEGNLQGLDNYLDRNTRFGWIIFWLEQIISFSIVFFGRKIMIKKDYNFSISEKAFVNGLYSVNYYMFFFLPLFVLDESFTRIIRNIMPLNSMTGAILISYMLTKYSEIKKISKNELIYILSVILYQVILFLLMKRTYSDSIITPVLEQNWIWR